MRALPRSVFLLLLAVYLATFNGPAILSDGEASFQTTSALARRGTFALGGTPEVEEFLRPKAREEGRPSQGPVRVFDDGERLYAWFGIGQALAAVPLYAVGAGLAKVLPAVEVVHAQDTSSGIRRSEYWAHLMVGMRNPILGAWTAALLAATCLRLGVGRRSSWWVAMAYGLCSFAWPQARSSLSDVQATFFLFAAFHALVRLRAREALGRGPSRKALMGLGALLAAAVLTRVALAPAAVALLAAAEVELCLGRTRRIGRSAGARRALVWAGLPLLFAAGLFLVTNIIRFGRWDDSGYALAVEGGLFRGDPRPGLMGLLVSPGRGLIWMAPFLVLAPLGMQRMLRRGERLSVWVPLFVFALSLAVAAPLEGWHGGHTYGPRYLLPALPFLYLGVGQAFAWVLEIRGGRTVLAVLVGFGLWMQVPAALVDTSTHNDLAMQAAAMEFEVDADLGWADANEVRFERTLWDLHYAAPGAHWRILRHRLAIGDEAFPVKQIFGLDSDAQVTPGGPRGRGFRHLAWVDWRRRLGLPLWPVVVVLLLLVTLGAIRSRWALDRRGS